MKLFCVILLIISAVMETTSGNLKVVGAAAPLVVEAGEDVVLPCSLQPSINAEGMRVEWFRLHLTDTVVHLYEKYEDRNERQMESYRERTTLFKEELQKGNASLKLSAARPSDEGAYKCYIESNSWYDDITVYVEVKGKSFHAWKIAVICISAFAVTFTAFTACIIKDKHSKKKLSTKQCSAITYIRLKSQYVREEMKLKKYNTSEEGYRRLIPAVTNCRKAHFAACNLTVQTIETLARALQSEHSALKHLDLSYNNLRDSGVELLTAGLRSSHCKLQTLSLFMCKLRQQSCESLQLVLQSENSSLKELDLSNNVLQDSGVELLCAGLKSSHCKLETLRLTNCNLTKKSCKFLTLVLQSKNTFLKDLDISNNNLKSSGVEQISDGLTCSHCKLEILRLASCNLTTECCKSLKFALQSENSSLKEMNLSNNDLHDSGVELLSVGLNSSKCKLQTLRLAICNLTRESCKSLTAALQSETSSLKELDLSNNDLQDSGVELLSVGLKSSHCKLEALRLSGCMVTEKGYSFLDSALSSNPSYLKELDLTYNHPGESGVKLLSTRLEDPHCYLRTLRVEHSRNLMITQGLRKYACELTLDPNTAHTRLSLCEGNRKVKRVSEQQLYPDHPERFDSWKEVLCREVLTGRCYWEAEWSGNVAMALTYKTIGRKGDSDSCRFGYNAMSWSFDCCNDRYIAWYNKNYISIPSLSSSCKRVGVYVDCAVGTVSFYSVSSVTHTLTHLHTFSSTFTEPLYAGFWVDFSSSVCVCDLERKGNN